MKKGCTARTFFQIASQVADFRQLSDSKSFFIFLTPYDVGCLRGSLTIVRMKTETMTAQLELSLPNQRACCLPNPPCPRATRAAFWFQRLRQVVQTAADRPALPSQKAAPCPMGLGPTGTNRELHFYHPSKCRRPDLRPRVIPSRWMAHVHLRLLRPGSPRTPQLKRARTPLTRRAPDRARIVFWADAR